MGEGGKGEEGNGMEVRREGWGWIEGSGKDKDGKDKTASQRSLCF